MSLEIIEYNTENSGEGKLSELLTTIKQRTGLELKTVPDNTGLPVYSTRFPDMETAQNIRFDYFDKSGTFFIDADNHFLCYSIESGLEDYSYVNYLYRALVSDFNGKLANVCYAVDRVWYKTMNVDASSGYAEDDSSKSNITLCPLRVYASNPQNGANNVYKFVKNCYVNYERKFQKGLKFIDQNGNRFVTLGGYILYKVD